MPAGTAEALGGGLAGLAAMVFFGRVADIENVQHGIGAGQPLSPAIAATAAAAVFASGLRHSLRSRAASPRATRAGRAVHRRL